MLMFKEEAVEVVLEGSQEEMARSRSNFIKGRFDYFTLQCKILLRTPHMFYETFKLLGVA